MASTSSALAITLAVADFLLASTTQATLVALQREDLADQNTLPILSTLRRTFAPPQAGALLALARLRQQARDKFPAADQLFFTGEALEQATAWPVAQHRAEWFEQSAPHGPLLDLGCGIGGDTIALAQRRPVIAIERDPLRWRFAQANLAVLGLTHQVTLIQADWTELLQQGTLPPASAAFADPSRRVNEKRVFSLHQIQPPLAVLLQLLPRTPALGVKVMPGVADVELPPNCGVEFVSHAGVCKEAILWFGPLARQRRWATVHTRQGWQTVPGDSTPPPIGELRPGLFLHEPDPALIRAGSFGALCTRLQAHLFDPQLAYLVGPTYQPDPLVQSFLIEEIHPFSLKVLNQRLKARQIGQVELKKRGFPVEPEQLRPQLTLQPGGRAAVVFFTRRGAERLLLIGQRCAKVE
jgi:protein-L-isoaspartate O-methyltransferase